MPLPPPISRIEAGHGRGSWKSPFRRGEAEHHPRLGVVRQEVGDEALGVPLDGDLQLLPPSLRRGRRIAAPVPCSVDLDRNLDELARPEAPPGAIRAQGQGDALLRSALDRHHFGSALAGDEEGVDLFEVAVDPVRPRERVEQAEAEAGTGEFGRHAPNNVTSNAVTSNVDPSPHGRFGAVAAAENDLTIEELAAKTGMTVRNIRSHRARGLLPAPEVRDRVGYYGPQHLARLRMIQELQADGFNLKGIERLLSQSVGAAEQFLSIRRALDDFDGEQPRTFTRDELSERFGSDPDDALKRAIKVGALVPVDEERFEAPFPSLLDAAEEVVAAGVPLDHALVVIDKARGRCRSISHEFVKLFLEDVWKPFEREGYPEERWPEVRDSLDKLRPLSLQALVAVYRMTMSDEVEEALGKQLERMANRKA